MNEEILNENDIKIRYSDIDKKIKNKAKKSRTKDIYVLFIFSLPLLVLLSVLLLSVIIAFIFQINITIIAQRIYDFEDSIFYYLLYSIIYFPITALIIVTYVSYRRTHYKGFLIESLVEMQTLIALFFIITLLNFQKGGIFLPIIILISFIVIPTIGHSYINRPLIFESFKDTKNLSKSDIIVKQSLFVNEFQNGYTSRPVFEDLSKIISEVGDVEILKKKIKEFVFSLASHGDLLGYDFTENKIILYLRTTLIQRLELRDPFKLFKKMNQILKKKNLTMITIDTNNWEINFKLNKYDYDIYDNITYKNLSERVLSQFITSITEYVKGNFIESYESINPTRKKEKSTNINGDEGIRLYIELNYLMGMIIVYFYSIQAYLLDPRSLLSFTADNPVGIILLLVGWPFLLLYFFFNNLNLFILYSALVLVPSSIIYFIYSLLREYTKKEEYEHKKRMEPL